jgi:GT2 family glycosyltransferase
VASPPADQRQAPARPPVKIAVLDAEQGAVELAAQRDDGVRYGGLWLLLRSRGVPRALVKRDLDEGATTLIDPREILTGLGADDPLPPPGVLPDPPPAVSVVVATTFSRDDELRNCVRAIVALDYPSFEVLLVDNSQDGREPPAWLADHPLVRLLHEPYPGSSAARNRGMKAASGKIVAYTDDDTEVDPGWLRALVTRLAAHPDEAAVTGLTIPKELETPAQIALEEYYHPEQDVLFEPLSRGLAAAPGHRHALQAASVESRNDRGELVGGFSLYEAGRFGAGSNVAFRVEPLRAVGGFDLGLGPGTLALAGEDIELFARLAWRGHSIGFEPAALVHHVHRRDEASLRRQIEGYGVGLTAAAVALSFDDPRHLGALAATTPRAARLLGRNFWRKLRSSGPVAAAEAPPSDLAGLARIELVGMAQGPLAYLRSRRRVRSRPAP